jgi:hypothetical protein
MYRLFCEGLIFSFRADEGLDGGEVGVQNTLVVVSDRVRQPRSERSRIVVDVVKPASDKGSATTISKFSCRNIDP